MLELKKRNEALNDACSTIQHGQCKWFRVNADRDGIESACKRLDHKHFRFAVPWFKAYDCGQFSGGVCRDFTPARWSKYLYEHWQGFDDYFGEDFAPTGLVGIVVDGNTSERYMIKESDFINGTFTNEDGTLKWVERVYCKISKKSPYGYTLVHEPNPNAETAKKF